MNNTAIFILTYGRANNILTYHTLLKANCKSKIYFVVSDDDKQLEEYKKIYGKDVIVFSKEKIRPYIDMCDNFEKKKCVVYARNVIFDIAKDMNIDYFCVLDDDYNCFKYRRVYGDILKDDRVLDITIPIEQSFKYLINTDKLDCLAWSQGGDFIGGAETFPHINGKRKIMNAFFFKTKSKIRFMGSINEDLNASVYEGSRGKVFFTINDISINQLDTQQNKGGLTDIYLDLGTYVKSFYSVIVAPSCVKISTMGNYDYRIHHKVLWNKVAPKIIREIYKK